MNDLQTRITAAISVLDAREPDEFLELALACLDQMSPAALSRHQLARIMSSIELERPLPGDWAGWRTWLGPSGDHPLRYQLDRARQRRREVERVLWATQDLLKKEQDDFGSTLAELERRLEARRRRDEEDS